ncbi:MAG: 8-amino-7-oxononanoate synthase [Gammaproteobacteria bacterium]|nr:8-amino-7-oxononanoate synthase [Gammaproteobacteria bacterium]
MVRVSWREDLLRQQQHIKDEGRWRKRKMIGSAQHSLVVADDCWLTNFSSNDYLGFASHPILSLAATNAQDKWGTGAGASHLVCGHQSPHEALESELAEWLGAQRVLLFSNGYMANLAICTSLADKGDLILQDRLNHASLIDGGRLSAADFKRYKHCDLEHADTRCSLSSFNSLLLVTDGVFSMDGDVAPISGLKNLVDEFQGILCVDDAHGFGVLGDQGRGSLSHHGLKPEGNVVMMGTLGKAFGVYGAFVAGDEVIVEHLIQTGRNYIYTTALPPSIPATASASLKMIKSNWLGFKRALHENIELFRGEASRLGLPLTDSLTPIQPIIIGDEHKCLAISDRLLDCGFLIGAIRYPTVAKGSARLRVVISASHTEFQIRALVNALNDSIKSSVGGSEGVSGAELK